MGSALSDVLPLALGVAISPFPIIAVLLMLLSERERSNAWAFLGGWALTLALVATITVLTGITLPGGDDTPTWIPVGEVMLGAGLLLAAPVVWRRRSRGPGGGHARWLAVVDDITPPRAAGLGAILVLLNAKDMALTIDAGAKISQADLSLGGATLVVAAFVAAGSVTVLAPVLVATFAGEHAEPTLRRWHVALDRHGPLALALLLAVGGVLLMADGASRL